MKSPLYFDWGVSMLFGWGVYGFNLMRYWPRVSGSRALCIGQISLETLAGSDALTLRALSAPLIESDHLHNRLQNLGAVQPVLDGVVLHSLGNQMGGSKLPSLGGPIGSSTAGVIFFEDTNLPQAVDVSRQYSVIIAGSTWCEDILRGKGVDNVTTVIQGVDPALFHPAPSAELFEDRFVIFSGGKLEHRKAQDLVVLAFRAFAERHMEALLVTAWHSPWPFTALTVNGNPLIQPIGLLEDGRADSAGWIAANGIDPEQFIDVGSVPNHQMPRILREMDVALFPNRCEGGTNLVAMECMACGIPTILSDNTGHQDLIRTGGTFALTRQTTVSDPHKGTEGWGESNIEEIVEMLEAVWRDRAAASDRARIGAAAMADSSWRRQIGKLHDSLVAFGADQG